MSRGGRYAQVMAWAVAAALLGGAAESLAVSAAGASQTSTKALSVKLTLSGAGRGAITDNGQSACDYGGVNTDGATELSDLQGSVSGYQNVDSWKFNIEDEKGNGTFAISPYGSAPFKKFRNQVSLTPVLKDLNLIQMSKEELEAVSGTVTIEGDSGSITAAMWTSQYAGYVLVGTRPPASKEFKLVGTWNCK